MAGGAKSSAALLRPPAAFGLVEAGVYRCDAPLGVHFDFLRALRLRTAVLLSAELPILELLEFFGDAGVRVVRLEAAAAPLAAHGDAADAMKEALELVLARETHPVLLVCPSGVHQTGLVVGCLRRLQGWSLTAILAETKRRYLAEQFIDLFDPDLVCVPRHPPAWFVPRPPRPGPPPVSAMVAVASAPTPVAQGAPPEPAAALQASPNPLPRVAP